MSRMLRICLLGRCFPVSVAACCTPRRLDLRRVADGVDKHYNGLASLEAGFSESYRGGGLARSESGTMWLKKPGKMRWEYDNPVKKLFVTDGKTAWFYVPGERQARRAAVKRLDDLRSPLRYLLGHTKLEKEFSVPVVCQRRAPRPARGFRSVRRAKGDGGPDLESNNRRSLQTAASLEFPSTLLTALLPTFASRANATTCRSATSAFISGRRRAWRCWERRNLGPETGFGLQSSSSPSVRLD